MYSSPVKPEELGIKHGEILVKVARKAIESYITSGVKIGRPSNIPEELLRPGASFVTLLKIIGGETELRGCIGFIKPIEPLINNVINAAIAAATEDPRFPPLRPEELKSIVIEVSVLSELVKVERRGRDRVKAFAIGLNGLVIRRGFYSGLLLPEVPVEYCWDRETFISETCLKAGLPPDCWLDANTELYKFTARTFRETRPGGPVIIRDLSREYREKCGSIASR